MKLKKKTHLTKPLTIFLWKKRNACFYSVAFFNTNRFFPWYSVTRTISWKWKYPTDFSFLDPRYATSVTVFPECCSCFAAHNPWERLSLIEFKKPWTLWLNMDGRNTPEMSITCTKKLKQVLKQKNLEAEM